MLKSLLRLTSSCSDPVADALKAIVSNSEISALEGFRVTLPRQLKTPANDNGLMQVDMARTNRTTVPFRTQVSLQQFADNRKGEVLVALLLLYSKKQQRSARRAKQKRGASFSAQGAPRLLQWHLPDGEMTASTLGCLSSLWKICHRLSVLPVVRDAPSRVFTSSDMADLEALASDNSLLQLVTTRVESFFSDPPCLLCQLVETRLQEYSCGRDSSASHQLSPLDSPLTHSNSLWRELFSSYVFCQLFPISLQVYSVTLSCGEASSRFSVTSTRSES